MDASLNQQAVLATVTTLTIPPRVNHIFPERILRDILDLSIEGPVLLPPPRDDERRLLTQVCREWRRVILSTPTYWTSFDFARWAAQHPNDLFRLAECFFYRSGNTTSISIRFGTRLQSDIGRSIFELVIRPRAHRVCYFSCSITKDSLRILFSGLDPVNFQVLRVLDVAVICDLNGTIASRFPVSDSIDLSGFQRAPRLQYATLHVLNGIHPNDLKLPWGQLTRIDLGHTSVQVHVFRRIMEESVFLEEGVFCINFAHCYDGQPTRLRRISIPLLRSLTLRLYEPSQDSRLFGSLDIPLLEILWVEREEAGRARRDMTIYETLIGSMNANLKHFTIAEFSIPTTRWFIPRLTRSPRITYQQLDGVVRSCRHLTSLFLDSGVFIDPLVLEKMATGEFLPFLEQLGISSVKGWDIIWMVKKKNFASTLPDSGPSSSPAIRSSRPVALNYLRLSIMGCGFDETDIQKLEDAARALDLVRGYRIRPTDIADASNFD